jgi:hypothetical protein
MNKKLLALMLVLISLQIAQAYPYDDSREDEEPLFGKIF